MDEILSAVFRGMTYGSIYALLAVGLVLTYKTAGVFNLAFGAQAFAAGAVFYEARTRHDLPIPLAVVIALVFSAVLGYVLDRMLFRYLRTAPPMARLVTTLGLLVAIPEIVKLFFDVGTTYQPQGIVPDGSTAYHPFGGVFVSRDDIATAAVTITIVLALLVLFRYSPLGLRMRAVVESTRMTELAGVNADRVSTTAWVLSSLLAGMAGVLISPTLSQVSEIYYTPLVVAAISAAVLAALSNIFVAFLGGLLLGIIAQVIAVELPTNSILATNLRPSLPFVALFLVLVFSPKLRNRKEVSDPLAGVDPPPPALVSLERSDSLTLLTRIFGVVVGGGFFYWLFFHANVVWIFRTQYAVIFAIIFLSITVITGMAGEISLCQATFAGIGALATGQLAHELGMSVLVGMLLAGCIAAAVGALVALPALRLGGIFLSLATFAFALFFDSVMVKFTWVSGGNGITPLKTPRPLIGPIDFANEKSFLVLCMVILTIAGLLVVWVRGGTTGRFLDALRGSEVAAAAVGINPTRWRITAFALSAGLAGVGGGLLAMREQSASYGTFFIAQLGVVWVVVVVSLGSRTVEGAIQAAAGFIFFQRVVLESWIPWLFNNALGPVVLVIALIIALRLITHRFVILSAIAATFGVAFLVYYLVGGPSWKIDSVPTGLATVFFGIGAITYAKYPEGVLEHNKRISLARAQRWLDKMNARRTGTDISDPPPDVPASMGAAVESAMSLLEASGVTMKFAGITALDRVSLDVGEGDLVGLIGPNGAGKTTFFNCLLGILTPDGGSITLEGKDLTRVPTHRRARLGIGRTFQRIELFSGMSPREHLLVADRSRAGRGGLLKDAMRRGGPTPAEEERAAEMLALLGLEGVADRKVESLSLGMGRLVEVGRALMTEPRLLLLDEPSSGLDRQETDTLAATLREVQRERNFAILLVEHDVDLVRAFVERVFVLDFGTVIAAGRTDEVFADTAVRRAYLGDMV